MIKKPVYNHYLKWEDYQHGMWNIIPKHQERVMLKKAIEFTSNYELYGEWMIIVVKNWSISCEENFTKPSINHRAWVGHAACCMAIGCPEYITRLAWKHLTKKQQDDANKKADEAILMWKYKYIHEHQCNMFYEK